MIKKIIKKMKIYMTPLHYLRVCYFFLNILFVITLYYIYDVNQNIDQISSDGLNENFTFHAFVIFFYGLIFVFEIGFFLLKTQHLDKNFYEPFFEIIFLILIFLIPMLLIFGLISENISLKKDILFPGIFEISEVLRKMPKEEAQQLFGEFTRKFPKSMLEKNPQNFGPKVIAYHTMIKHEDFIQTFENLYSMESTKEKFIAELAYNYEWYGEYLDEFIPPNTKVEIIK